jgi:hypothetical protein
MLRFPNIRTGIKLNRAIFEAETIAYSLLSGVSLTAAEIVALDTNIKSIKYGSGITLSSLTLNTSNVASYYFFSNPSVDLRPYTGFYASISDGTKIKKVLLGALGTGITVGTDVGNDFTNWTGAVPTGWSQIGTPDASNYTEQSPVGSLHIVSNGSLIGIQKGTVVVGSLLRSTIDISSITGQIIAGDGVGFGLIFTTTGDNQVKYATCTNATPSLKRQTACNATLDNWKLEPVLTPSALGLWYTPVSEEATWNPNAASFTVTITRN